MYLVIIGLVVLNLYTLKNNVGGEDKFYSMKFLTSRFFLPLIAYCLLAFMVGTIVANIFVVIGVITAMVDVRCQHLKTEKDKKISYYNKTVVEANCCLIITYILLLSCGVIG